MENAAASVTTVARPLPRRRADNFPDRIRTWVSEYRIAIAGWVLAFISMVVAIISLLPGFNGQESSRKALELAQWTALKDYIEQCNDKLKAGKDLSNCEEAIDISLPPPPHINVHSLHPFRRLIARDLTNISNGVPPMTAKSRLIHALTLAMILLVLAFLSIFLITAMARRLQQRFNLPASDPLASERLASYSFSATAPRPPGGLKRNGGRVSPSRTPSSQPDKSTMADYLVDQVPGDWMMDISGRWASNQSPGDYIMDVNTSGLRKRNGKS